MLNELCCWNNPHRPKWKCHNKIRYKKNPSNLHNVIWIETRWSFWTLQSEGPLRRQPSSAVPPCGESEDSQEQSALQEAGTAQALTYKAGSRSKRWKTPRCSSCGSIQGGQWDAQGREAGRRTKHNSTPSLALWSMCRANCTVIGCFKMSEPQHQDKVKRNLLPAPESVWFYFQMYFPYNCLEKFWSKKTQYLINTRSDLNLCGSFRVFQGAEKLQAMETPHNHTCIYSLEFPA